MIAIRTTINAPIAKVWTYYTEPEHIMQWNNASDDWHTTLAQNDLREGGKFLFRMEAKDGSAGFDFSGAYEEVMENSLLSYGLNDGRKVTITFMDNDGETDITIVFEAETVNSIEMQEHGWQAILDNFKKYVESLT